MAQPPKTPPNSDLDGKEKPSKQDHGAAEQEELARKESTGRPADSKR